MYRDRNKRTLVVGPREFTVFVLALAALSVAVVIAVYAFTRGGESGREAVPTLAPTTAADAAPQALAPEEANAGPTPVLAATIAPTPEIVTHIVQEGEGLIGIAAFYGVDLNAILDANGLAADSVIWPGQELLVPLDAIPQGTWHTVQPGETLEAIALHYGVSVEEIQNTNSLPDPNAIYEGQRLAIPGVVAGIDEVAAQSLPDDVTPTPTPDPLEGIERGPLMSDWPRSILEGDLDENYPSVYDHARFTLHYQPGTYPDQHLEQVVSLIADALARVESTLGVTLNGKFDIYAAGTLYEVPNAHLRGLSRSLDRRLFVLLDGSGDEAENAYLVTHEMTHLVSWNTLGAPSSTMLSEGLATYVGEPALEEGGYLPYDQVCLGAYAAGQMSSMAVIEKDWQAFQGHIRYRFNYFGSACFVGYLIDTYGMEAIRQLYHTSDYPTLYGESLAALDSDWQASLAARQAELTIDPAELADYTEDVTAVYAYVLGSYNGTSNMHRAYALADQARLALWRGDYPAVQRALHEVYTLTGFTP
jgi:LysM repeat protein